MKKLNQLSFSTCTSYQPLLWILGVRWSGWIYFSLFFNTKNYIRDSLLALKHRHKQGVDQGSNVKQSDVKGFSMIREGPPSS